MSLHLLPDNNTWRGDGNNLHVTPDFYSNSGSTTFTFTYSGSAISNFSVRLYNRDTGKLDSTLINVTGTGDRRTGIQNTGRRQLLLPGGCGRNLGNRSWREVSSRRRWASPRFCQVSRTDDDGKAYYTFTQHNYRRSVLHQSGNRTNHLKRQHRGPERTLLISP